MATKRAWTEERPGGVLPRWRGPDGTKNTEALVQWDDAKRPESVRAKALAIAERAASESVLIGPAIHQGRKSTVGEVGDEYHREMVALGTWRPKTASLYDGFWRNHAKPKWGTYLVADVGHRDVQAWVGALTASGMSGSSVQKCHQSLSRVMDYAVRGGLVAVNPCKGVALPPLGGRERRAIPDAHLRAILDAVDGDTGEPILDPVGRLFVVMLAETGLRVGEAAGLVVGALDLDHGAVHVAEQLQEDDAGKLRRSAPKTKAGTRWVPLHPNLVAALRAHVEGRAVDAAVFTTPTGSEVRVPNFRSRCWVPAVTAAGFDYKIHELRHTRMTRWAEAGVPVEKLVLWGGYSKAGHVLDVYVHPQRKAGSDAVAALPSLLDDPPTTPRHLRAV
jgi:integrase